MTTGRPSRSRSCSGQAQAEEDSGGNIAAARVVAEALKRLGRQPPLLQTYEAYVHNAFASCSTRGRRLTRRPLIDQGLAVYPDSRMLQQDLDLAQEGTPGQPFLSSC